MNVFISVGPQSQKHTSETGKLRQESESLKNRIKVLKDEYTGQIEELYKTFECVPQPSDTMMEESIRQKYQSEIEQLRVRISSDRYAPSHPVRLTRDCARRAWSPWRTLTGVSSPSWRRNIGGNWSSCRLRRNKLWLRRRRQP